jgi:hypothetical protein
MNTRIPGTRASFGESLPMICWALAVRSFPISRDAENAAWSGGSPRSTCRTMLVSCLTCKGQPAGGVPAGVLRPGPAANMCGGGPLGELARKGLHME